MKQAIILIILFTILAVTFTATMINIKKNEFLENYNEYTHNTPTNNQPTDNSPKEKTIDLDSTYRKNNITVETEEFTVDGYALDLPQISGLIDKTVQTNINDSIKNKANEFAKRIINNDDKNKTQISTYFYDIGNFSNTISIKYGINYIIEDDNKNEIYKNYAIGLNYELINGKELTLDDFFAKDVDPNDIYKAVLYKLTQSSIKEDFYWEYSDLRYDNEKGTWVADYDDWEDPSNSGVVDYVLKYDDYYIEKKVKKFSNLENRNFSYSQDSFWVWEKDDGIDVIGTRLFMKDFADKITIYDKFKTDYNIFEDDEDYEIFACMSPEWSDRESGKRIIKIENDNFYYDVNYLFESDINDDSKDGDFKKKLVRELNTQIDDTINEYREKSLKGDTFYFILMNPQLEISEYNFLIQRKNLRVLKCDIENKKNLLDFIMKAYRYYNIGWYGIYNTFGGDSASDFYDESFWDNPKYINEFDNSIKIYNISSQKEYNDISEMFKSGVDYKKVIADYVEKFRNETVTIDKIDLEKDGFTVNRSEENIYGAYYIPISDIKEYMNIFN